MKTEFAPRECRGRRTRSTRATKRPTRKLETLSRLGTHAREIDEAAWVDAVYKKHNLV